MVEKQHRDAFLNRSLWRTTQRLQMVHADICGPIKPLSNSKKKYFLSFNDDYRCKVWIYFLTEISEVFTIFKNFKNLVEKETGPLTSSIFFCKTNGISRQLIAAYTLKQNGVAERKSNNHEHGQKYIIREASSKEFLAKSSKLDSAHAQQKSYSGSERYDS